MVPIDCPVSAYDMLIKFLKGKDLPEYWLLKMWCIKKYYKLIL